MVNEHLPKRGCPSCGARTWDVVPGLFFLSSYEADKGRPDVNSGAPLAAAFCKGCGFMLLYGAMRTGELEPRP